MIKAKATSCLHYGSMLSGLLVLAVVFSPLLPATAGDDLLDPSQIGSVHKSAGADQLLDVSQIGNSSGKSAGISVHHHRVNYHPPSYARSMARSVVTSMDNLTQVAANLIDEINKLDQAERDLADKLKTLAEDRDTKMDEYRQGLFCSGCDRTRSDILSKGEIFPHKDQHSYKKTPEQLAEKERELQAPIDRTQAELKDALAKRIKDAKERDEAFQQIEYGLDLWRTSIGYENVLLEWDEKDSVADYKTDRAKTEDQIRKNDAQAYSLKLQMPLAKSKADADQALADIAALYRKNQTWANTQQQLDEQRTQDRHTTQDLQARARDTAMAERDVLNGFLVRGHLPQQLHAIVTATTGAVPVGASRDVFGVKYRMGSYDSAGHDDVLPRVNSFITDYLNSNNPGYQSDKTINGQGTLPPPSSINQLKGSMKDLLDSAPAPGDGKPAPSKNSGTGIRG